MATKVKTKENLGVQMALKVIEEGKKPMSADQIRGKYQLEFPFVIKRVVKGYMIENEPMKGNEIEFIRVGAFITITGINRDDGLYTTDFRIDLDPKSERFVWVGDKA